MLDFFAFQRWLGSLHFAPFSSAFRTDGWLGGWIRGTAGEWSPPDTRRLGGLCIGIRLVIDAVLARRAEEEHCIAFFTCTAEAAHALGIRISLFYASTCTTLTRI